MNIKINQIIRVFALAGTLFLFLDCAGRVKPWVIKDRYSLSVKILETNQWLEKTRIDSSSLDLIMRGQLKYYLKNDMRIYDRLDPNYEKLRTAISNIDSIYKDLKVLTNERSSYSSTWLDSIPNKSSKTIRIFVKNQGLKVNKFKKEYHKSLKNINKAFKKERKKLTFVDDEIKSFKNTLFKIKYKRSLLNEHLERFNKKANMAFFEEPNSFYSKEIQSISKNIESSNKKLDKYENFLSNIREIAMKEVGGSVYLLEKKDKVNKYNRRFLDGYKEYLIILDEMRKTFNSL